MTLPVLRPQPLTASHRIESSEELFHPPAILFGRTARAFRPGEEGLEKGFARFLVFRGRCEIPYIIRRERSADAVFERRENLESPGDLPLPDNNRLVNPHVPGRFDRAARDDDVAVTAGLGCGGARLEYPDRP